MIKVFLRAGVRLGVLLAFLLVCQSARSQTQPTAADSTKAHAPGGSQTPQKDLTKVSIEDLMNVEVTSASKTQQKLSRVAAAIFGYMKLAWQF